MAYSRTIRKKALMLYTSGKTLADIRKELKIPNTTLVDWKNRYNWNDKVEDAKKKAIEEEKENIERINKKVINGINLMMDIAFSEDNLKRIAASCNSVKELENLMRLKAQATGGPTEVTEVRTVGADTLHKLYMEYKDKNP